MIAVEGKVGGKGEDDPEQEWTGQIDVGYHATAPGHGNYL